MTLYCGGRERGHEITSSFAMVYRLSVVGGEILGPDHKIPSGDNQPNCALCDECWLKTPTTDYMTYEQALAALGDQDHVFAYCPADSGETSFGTKQWSSIETKTPWVFLPATSISRYPVLEAVINDMHDRQAEFARRQTLCDAKTCDCSQQKRKEWVKGDMGLHAGTRVRWKASRWKDDSTWLEGKVVYHDHPPYSNFHRVHTDDGRRFHLDEVFEVDSNKIRANFGGCVGLSIPDRSKLDRKKAIEAFQVLWNDAAERMLDAVPLDGTETGATFTGTAEKYTEFEKLLDGSGVEADAIMPAATEAQLKTLEGV